MRNVLVCLLFAFGFAFGLLNAQQDSKLPVASESGMPHLVTGADGKVYLSFIDYLGAGGHALRYSQWMGSDWTAPQTIVQGRNWFVNWADFPSISVLPDGSMLAHWLTRSETGGKFGYGIRIAKKEKGAKAWREIYGVSLEEKEDYSGFLSFVPKQPGAVFLSPPPIQHRSKGHKPSEDGHGADHRKTVRFVSFAAGKKAISQEVELDADACSCCQTAVAATPDGLIAAYRDHLPGDIRDISIVRYTGGAWTQPRTLHADGWKINGCPTDGPSIAVINKHVAIVWLTRAADQAKVLVALSRDSGVTFGKPIRIDDGDPPGRANLIALDDSNYLATWIEKIPNAESEIRLKRISLDGFLSPSVTVTKASPARPTGFPKIAVLKDRVLVVWRADRVRAVTFAKTQILSNQ